MLIAYIVVAVLTAAANLYSAALDLRRDPRVLANMDRGGVPESLLPTLVVLKTAGAVGLLVGIFVPVLGTAAAVGLVLFFLCAVFTHVRARFWELGPASVFLALAVATLGVSLAR